LEIKIIRKVFEKLSLSVIWFYAWLLLLAQFCYGSNIIPKAGFRIALYAIGCGLFG
jgi:hypothetical protein